MRIARLPRADLRSFVDRVWAHNGSGAAASDAGRELVLPTGAMHVVIRLGDRPLRLFRHAEDAVAETVGCAVVGGARAAPYLRDVSQPTATVGALLRPGAAELLLGTPASALVAAHTPLGDLWGDGAVSALRDRLTETSDLSCRLAAFEAALAQRLPAKRGIDPLVAHALVRFAASCRIGTVVDESGWSHRHFAQRFRTGVGLGPKTYCRVLRFGRVLERLAGEPSIGWADMAAAEGYADQAHFAREFRALAGLTPGRYRRLAPTAVRHVPVPTPVN